ncbi:MAG TPA: hypothetical protein VMB03_13900 [Bryobacteraceae bacterium]|nr:hypothetical protein [Bryobacteraceae bacterium]
MSNSELINRYLNAVRPWLPRKQQADILAELAEDLQSQIEERESAAGRTLTLDELAAVLKQRGSPLRVASGYLPQERLINPAMLPIYFLVLRVVLLWVLLPILILVSLAPIVQSGHPLAASLRFLAAVWQTPFFVIGIITTIFFLVDRYQDRWVDRWDPRKLPRVPASHPQMQWHNDFAGFAFGSAMAFFWAVTMWHRSAFVLDNGLRIGLVRVWGELYWLILVLTASRAAVNLYCFLRPAWNAARSWIRLALDGVEIAFAMVLLKVPNWVEISGPKVAPADASKLVGLANGAMQLALVSIPVILAFDVYRQGRLLRRAKDGQSAPILTLS